ncbi:hypothetical protein BS50DRAFT_648474 [Corynespora cassiicola Philippines]|uniref:Uncharacterized protein n=1 Tax=Corynespora cassiicola Philippines TaxID=1448308 RepID=A0A2T2NCB3_CORCC|nr:hypothetical protein BS50DRAFT_648474 [Corynespora cassiicola Philippines]
MQKKGIISRTDTIKASIARGNMTPSPHPDSNYLTNAHKSVFKLTAGQRAARTKRNAEKSRLLRIPRDIRFKILVYILGGQILKFNSTYDHGVRPIDRYENAYVVLGACLQIYREGRMIPFTHNFFSFSSLHTGITAFLKSLQPWQRAVLSVVQLKTQSCEFMMRAGGKTPGFTLLRESKDWLRLLPGLKEVRIYDVDAEVRLGDDERWDRAIKVENWLRDKILGKRDVYVKFLDKEADSDDEYDDIC